MGAAANSRSIIFHNVYKFTSTISIKNDSIATIARQEKFKMLTI
jgi:hypothetical protein